MKQEPGFGTYDWMLTHAVEIERIDPTARNRACEGFYSSLMVDVMIMILCKAFLSSSKESQSNDSE
jgi:hypothetical protein